MRGVLKLFTYMCVGEVIVYLTGVPVPGPMIGLVLMLIDFTVCRQADPHTEAIFDAVSPHLTILFVPAGAGIVAHTGLLSEGLLVIVIAVLAGTIATILTTALLFRLCIAADQPVHRPHDSHVSIKAAR